LLDAIRARPDFDLLQTVLLRSLSQAQYRPENERAFRARPRLTRFHVALRRYPDLPCIVRSRQCASKRYTPSGMTWEELGEHTSMTERRADDASRDVTNWLKCHFMQDKIGEEFDGTISGVTSFGLFVTLDGLNIDGLVLITELGRDYFHFDAGRHALIGERGGRVFQLAGRVRVRVARVDMEQTKIDFTLAEEAAPELPTPSAPPTFSEPLSRNSRPPPPKGRGRK
jgi:ribonuclease R